MLFLEKVEQKRKVLIALLIVVLAVATIYSCLFVKQRYVSSSTHMLMKTVDNKNVGNVEMSDSFVETLEELLKSKNTLGDVAKVKENKITLNRVSKSDTFKINVSSKNEAYAVAINEEIVKTFTKNVSELYEDTTVYTIDSASISKVTKGISVLYVYLISILVYIALTISYVVFLMHSDNDIKSKEDVEVDLSLKDLIEIPLIENKNKKKSKNIIAKLISVEKDKTPTAKAFKKLRSNIQFLNVNNKEKNIILVTSSNPKEGKSYVAANIAVSFAEVGKKVILIDADMKNGRQDKIFNIPNNLGFSNYLSCLDTNGVEINELVNKFINETAIKNLNVITSGTVPPNPSELLASPRLNDLIKDLTVFYDVVVIDTTSVLTSTDPLILTRNASSTILVVDTKKSKKEDIWKSKRDIQNVGGRIIGIILNKVKLKKQKLTKAEKRQRINQIKEKIKQALDKLSKLIMNDKELMLLDEAKDVNVTVINENAKQEEIKEEKADIVKAVVEETIENANEEKINLFANVMTSINTKFSDFVKDRNFKEKDAKQEVIPVETVKEEPIENQQVIPEVIPEVKEEVTYENENTVVPEMHVSFKEQALGFLFVVKENIVNIYSKVKDVVLVVVYKVSEMVSNLSKKHHVIEELENDKEIKENEQLKMEGFDVKKSGSVIDIINTNEIQPERKVIDDYELSQKEDEEQEHYEISEDGVLVIVDAENGYCRAFSKFCFTEKLIRGIDREDGFNKAFYSSSHINKTYNKIIELFDIDKSQVKRIDTLVYKTLVAYDETVWIEKKIESHKAEAYVYAMSKEYERQVDESLKEYELRTRRARKAELIANDIDIEYKLENLFTTSKLRLTDKIVAKKNARMFEICSNEKNNIEKNKSKSNREFYKNILAYVSKFSHKTSKEVENPEEVSVENQKVIEEKLKKKAEEEQIRLAKKLEKEQRRKERKAINAQRRKEEKAEKAKRQEELRRKRETERERQKEEARIEEELLEDNLYPKTKYNKDI